MTSEKKLRKRGFEVVSSYKDKKIALPQRKTAASAGYDIASAMDFEILPGQIFLVPTGLKAYMQADEYLGIHIRSSIAVKNKISCINNQGIIDSDYYNNPDNEGHIMIPLINFGDKAFKIEKGMRIAQGIFYGYLTADDDKAGNGASRQGGFGSTGE